MYEIKIKGPVEEITMKVNTPEARRAIDLLDKADMGWYDFSIIVSNILALDSKIKVPSEDQFIHFHG